MDERPPSGWRPLLVIAAVVFAVASPALRNRDSFPLSTYPIYAHARGRVANFDTVVGVRPNGDIERLSLEIIANTDDPLIASAYVSNAVRAGDAAALCSSISSRVDSELTRIEIVSERHDTVDWLRGNDSMHDRTVHASCEVRG